MFLARGRLHSFALSRHLFSPARIFVLNVGGQKFHTTMDTLTSVKDSRLHRMLEGVWDPSEELFIDRDPTYFHLVLNRLRDPWFFDLDRYELSASQKELAIREICYYNYRSLVPKAIDMSSGEDYDAALELFAPGETALVKPDYEEGGPSWLEFYFEQPVVITTVTLTAAESDAGTHMSDFKLHETTYTNAWDIDRSCSWDVSTNEFHLHTLTFEGTFCLTDVEFEGY
eukprot:TRINITY_DN8307_c0_g1_i1.p1 TRINITY_DN8307_c0_g1~~TRINITY_DN8307_c0_g1_i1.p1  ORF type:complete len:228 (+),score=15.18 TRINITY_DN8307_c0_g1_i1:27-710(+)